MTEGQKDNQASAPAKPINHSEEFRRAVRNSLLWSALALVAGLGRATAIDVNVTFLGAGLAFNPRALCAGAMIGASYMFAVYVRASQRLVFENSRPKIEAKSGEMLEIIDVLIAEAQAARGNVSQVEKLGEAVRREAVSRLILASSTLSTWFDTRDGAMRLEQLRDSVRPGGMNYPQDTAAALGERTKLLIDERIRQLAAIRQQATDQANAMMEKLTTELPSTHAAILHDHSEQLERYDAATRRLTESRKELRQFDNDIANRERRWHWSLDVVAVTGLFVVALLASGARLSGYPPTNSISWLNPLSVASEGSLRPENRRLDP